MAERIVHEPPVAETHRLVTVRGPHGRDENPWHAECSCSWSSPLMRFAGDAALLGAQHVIEAELQAAQEREEAIRQLIRKPNGVIPSQWYWELPAKIDQVLAAQRTEEPSEQRFTEKGAECRNTHVKGYTGPMCSCPPLACYAVKRSEEPSE